MHIFYRIKITSTTDDLQVNSIDCIQKKKEILDYASFNDLTIRLSYMEKNTIVLINEVIHP